jgi:hypothetical protein
MFSERFVLYFMSAARADCLLLKTWEWKVKSFGPDKPMMIFWDDYGGGGVLSVSLSDQS